MKGTFFILAIFCCAISTPTSAETCRVMDPTGTPLNLRLGPNARIVGTIPNGVVVSMLDKTRDARGRLWVFIADATGQGKGWVYSEYLTCPLRSGQRRNNAFVKRAR